MNTRNKNACLMYWFVSMKTFSGFFATHYYQRHPDDPHTRPRPLSLTEDCDECFVLPILCDSHMSIHEDVDEYSHLGGPTLIRTIDRYSHIFYLPVFRASPNTDGQYKAIGIYLVSNLQENREYAVTRWNHSIGRDDVPTRDPHEILNTLFEKNNHDEAREFIIE
ncbi:hypothetical protein BDA99DRAFT_598137 [Phascolomyces articulosus]|uniref:Uncharacterized protein n=1 Tax=Phascolomyces articulosus TaxID=60185 RepID=A0AAD5K3W7_9FUNG|nr:hypothetical protein BDA99DRAFT_598137 [Phascolomyces articulosus]